MFRFTRTADLDSANHDDLCFAYDVAEAMAYGRGTHVDELAGGYLHDVAVMDWDRIASWEEVCEAVPGIDPDVEPMIYADRPAFRAKVAEAGFAGMVYPDAGPENAYQHECIRVWDRSVLTVRGTREVSADEVSAAWDQVTG